MDVLGEHYAKKISQPQKDKYCAFTNMRYLEQSSRMMADRAEDRRKRGITA